jgi:hypothetical protein
MDRKCDNISYPNFGDSIPGGCRLIIGIHSNTEPDCKALVILTPPSIPTRPLACFIWALFNTPEHAVSYAKDYKSFNLQVINNNGVPHLRVSTPTSNQEASTTHVIKLGYYLHRHCNNPHVLAGSSVVRLDGLCPAFDPTDNQYLFGHFFGVKFTHNGHEYVHAISQFELASCLRLSDEFTYCLAEPLNSFCLDCTVPNLTSAQIFDKIHEQCIHIRLENFEIFQPNQFAVPAEYTHTFPCVQMFLNGAVGTRLPSRDSWVKAYSDDPKMSTIISFVENSGTISQQNLEESKSNPNYSHALQQSHIKLIDGFLFYHKPIAGSESYARLQLVFVAFHNIVFIAFHSNPLGGHLNVVQTFHRIGLRFYWPNMFLYISRMCNSCPGCALTNPTCAKSRKLIYNFPVKARFLVLHIDRYQAGQELGFEGLLHYLIACCVLCTFAVMEPVANANVTTYASVIMKIILRFGFCHTCILNKDSKFLGVCCKELDFLQINCHVLSGGNHNSMLVKRLNRYLNKGLCIMTNEQDSNQIMLEAILLLITRGTCVLCLEQIFHAAWLHSARSSLFPSTF